MRRLLSFAICLFITVPATQAASPYAGRQHCDIKALSQEEMGNYLDGKGMGQAMAAELNGYPGPRHVLDLADGLELTAEQQEITQAIFNRMHAEAVRLGKRIVERERELGRAFAHGEMNEPTLDAILQELGRLKTRLRYMHLRAHLDQRSLMTFGQVQAYRKLRGYGASPENQKHRHEYH